MVKEREQGERPYKRGVVIVLMTGDRQVIVFGGELEEDDKKWENVRGGKWGWVRGIYFPGGAIEEGEGLMKAVQRELKEETGLEISIERDRLERVGGGFLTQERNGQVVDFGFDVVIVRITDEELDMLQKVVESQQKRLVFLRPEKPEKGRHLLWRPRDRYVWELLQRRA